MRYLLVVLALVASACGGNSSPAAPTPPSTTAAATIAIASYTVTGESVGAGIVYHVALQLRETGGTVGANISGLTFSDTESGGSARTTLPTTRILAGGTLTTPPIDITNSAATTPAATLNLAVAFTDDNNHTGTTTGSASVTRIVPVQRFSLVGFVTDRATGRGISGATVRVTSGPDNGASTTTANTGYYAFGALQTGSFTIQATAPAYVAAVQTVALTANTEASVAIATTPPPAPAVEYRITGSARRCDATYQNSTGGTNQATVNVPFSFTWASARTGDFLYMSCQISDGGDRGEITVAIYRNGTLYRSAQASGFPNIATASGSY